MLGRIFYSVEVLAEGFYTVTDGLKLKAVVYKMFFPPLHVGLLVSFTLIYLFFSLLQTELPCSC